MEERETPVLRIGVSTMALCVYSYGPGGTRRALKIAQKAGLAGVKLTPLRGLREHEIRTIPSAQVLSYEGDWRRTPDETSLVNYVLYGTAGQARQKCVLFSAAFPRAIPVDLGESSAVETSPVNLPSEKEYFSYPGGVALDLWHVRQFPWAKGRQLEDFVRKLAEGNNIRTIDFQTRDRQEFENFLAGQSTELGHLLALATKHRKDLSICIELPPQWLIVNPVRTLVRVREHIEKVVRTSEE